MTTKLLLLLALLNLVPSCAGAQTPGLGHRPLAVTGCSDSTASGYPVTHYGGPNPMAIAAAEELAAHEVVHRLQLVDTALGATCMERLRRITLTPDSTLKYEIPAYCAQLAYDVAAAGADHVTTRARMALAVAQVYRMDPLDVARKFAKACPAPDEVPVPPWPGGPP